MKLRLPDTMFTRLFGLALAVLLISHLVISSLFMLFAPQRDAQRPPPPPPAMAHPGGPPPGPPPGDHRQPPEFWLAQLITLGIITLLALYGARRLAQPIRQLTHAARLLGDNLQAPSVAEEGPAEVREAARLFNHMQDKLRQQMAARNRFLAAVSHDLRTPLTRIRLRASQIDDEALQQKLGKDIAEMADMLDATLAYLRDESVQEPWQWLNVTSLLEAMAEDWQAQQVRLTVTGHADRFYTLPASLRRCLENLLENVRRYGGGQADATLSLSAEQLEITLHDQGSGIPDDQLELVFEPFYRLETSRNRHTGGTGLGLAIARDAARRMGGELTLHNAPTGGLLARLVLPVTPPAPMYPS